MGFFGDLGSAVLGGLPFIGGGFAQEDQQDFSASQSHAQMQFQREMSNTAHQREMADLKTAGLNPILTATGGLGATTPGGAAGSSGQQMGSAQSTKMVESAYKKDRDKSDSEINKNKALENQLNEQSKLTSQSAKEVATRERILKIGEPAAKSQQRLNKTEADFQYELFEVMKAFKGINSAKSLKGLFKRKSPGGLKIKTPPASNWQKATDKAKKMRKSNRLNSNRGYY